MDSKTEETVEHAGLDISNLVQKKIENAPVEFEGNQTAHISFGLDFLTANDEEGLMDGSTRFRAIARIVARSVYKWDFIRPKCDDKGEVKIIGGKAVMEPAPITEDFLRSIGTDILSAIWLAMNRAALPNQTTSQTS